MPGAPAFDDPDDFRAARIRIDSCVLPVVLCLTMNWHQLLKRMRLSRARLGATVLCFGLLATSAASCGDNRAGIVCGLGTEAVDGVCEPIPIEPPLQPGHYLPPLVQLQRLQGDANHMHIAQVKYREADSKLFYCSYTFGMINASDPQNMRYQVQGLRHATPSGSPRTPGCLHLAWDEDDPNIVYTTHRGNIDFAVFLSGWDLTDTDAPVQLPALQEPGAVYGGIDVENGLVYVALQEGGLGIYDYDAGTGWTRSTKNIASKIPSGISDYHRSVW